MNIVGRRQRATAHVWLDPRWLAAAQRYEAYRSDRRHMFWTGFYLGGIFGAMIVAILAWLLDSRD